MLTTAGTDRINSFFEEGNDVNLVSTFATTVFDLNLVRDFFAQRKWPLGFIHFELQIGQGFDLYAGSITSG